MNSFYRLSIKWRFILMAVFALLSLFFTTFWYIYISENKKEEQLVYSDMLNLQSRFESFNTLVSRLPNIADTDFKFYKYGENELVKQVQLLEDSVGEKLADFQRDKLIKRFGLLENINRLYASFDKYGLQVFHFIELLKERGNGDVGLVSQNIRNSNELFKLGQKMLVIRDLSVAFNRFLHYEKLYYFTGDNSYREELVWFMNDIRPILSQHRAQISSIFSSDDEKLLDALVRNSVKNIEKLKQLEKELSPSQKVGVWNSINDLNKVIEADFAKSLSVLKVGIEEKELSRRSTFYVIVALLFGLNLFSILHVARDLRLSFVQLRNLFSHLGSLQDVEEIKYKNPELSELRALAQSVVDIRRSNVAMLGNLVADKPIAFDETTTDSVGKMFVEIQKKINAIREQGEKSKEDERLNSWHIQGQSKIEEVFRTHNVKLDVLSQELIKIVVDFLDVNQGALFMFDEQEQNLKLFAAYSFGKFKAVHQQFALGDGLVGSCALERKSIYMTEVPEGYFSIHSGLGEAPPTCIYLLPLCVDNKLYGVLEVASFEEFEFHVRNFLDSVSVNIASGFARIKTSYESEMLAEKTKLRSEEMEMREKELRDEINRHISKEKELEQEIEEQKGKALSFQNQLYRSKANEELMHMEILKYQELVKQLKEKSN